jgi:hypothetical protein
MTDTPPTTATRKGDPGESERAREQAEDDEGDSSDPPAQQSKAVSSGQRPSPGRTPLFGT